MSVRRLRGHSKLTDLVFSGLLLGVAGGLPGSFRAAILIYLLCRVGFEVFLQGFGYDEDLFAEGFQGIFFVDVFSHLPFKVIG